MKELIVSDFDDTLINSDEEIPASTVVVLASLRRTGYKFAIATGRPLQTILDYNRDFLFTDYIISNNGAVIYDCVKEKIIFHKSMLVSNVKKIVKTYYDKAIIYLVDSYNWNLISEKSAYNNDADIVNRIGNYEKFIEEAKKDINKIELYFKTLKEAETSLEEIKSLNLKVNVNLQISGDRFMLEITHQDVSKLTGVSYIASKNKIGLDSVVAFGDGHNDIELIKNVGVGVAVGNAVDELKEVAKELTDDCNHKGVEKFLKKKFMG